jgi:hypothetical protein
MIPVLAALVGAGQGSVLQQEIDQLKRMLKQGANWEVISQMMSYISDKAAQVGWAGRSCVAGCIVPVSIWAALPASPPLFQDAMQSVRHCILSMEMTRGPSSYITVQTFSINGANRSRGTDV